jgi:hypothetical protein
VVDRLFSVEKLGRAKFEQVFGPGGAWRVLLKRSAGYVRSDLQCEGEGQYRLRDFWTSHWEFESFRAAFVKELDEFNRQLREEGLIEREWLIGSYYVADDDNGEEGLVPV